MKERGYKVRITTDSVFVEHRASFRPRTLVILGVCYLCYCLLPPVRQSIGDFCRSGDIVFAGFSLLFLLIPVFFGASWLLFASGEVMHCDAQELRYARRRTWGRWHRFHCPSAQVRALQRTLRGGSNTRLFAVLTFEVEGRHYDMLEDLSYVDGEHILKTCRALGLDAIIPNEPDAGMQRDIEKRGWLVNPYRPD